MKTNQLCFCNYCKEFFFTEINSEERVFYVLCPKGHTVHYNSNFVELEHRFDDLYQSIYYHEYDKEKCNFEKITKFSYTVKKLRKGYCVEKIKKILNYKYSDNTKLKKLNSLEKEVEEIENYTVKFDMFAKHKKDIVIFYSNGERQKGWKSKLSKSFCEDTSNNPYYFFDIPELDRRRMELFFGQRPKDIITTLIESPSYELLYNSDFFSSEKIFEKFTHYNFQPRNLFNFYKHNTNTLTLFLRIGNNKSKLKYLRELSNDHSLYGNLDFRTLLILFQRHKFNDLDNQFNCLVDFSKEISSNTTIDIYRNIDRGHIGYDSYSSLIDIHETHNYNLKKLINYVNVELKDSQGLYKIYEAISLLQRYININKELELEFEKYPKSLKLEIDRLEYLKLLNKDKIMEKNFNKARLVNLEYEYSNDNYLVICPNSITDIKKEGLELGHCVGSYTEKYANQRSRIFFIRKKSEPDTPYITIELDNYFKCVQASGKSNRHLTETEEKFKRKWLDHVNEIVQKQLNETA